MNEYKKGGSIHISPSKKGTFTAAAKKHGKSVQAFASQVLAHPENYSPAMRKKANFARNSRRWKHGLGGNLYGGGGFTSLVTTPVLPDVEEIRHRLYNGVNPAGYQYIPERIWDALNKKEANRSIYRDDQWATYLQIPEEERHSGVEKLQPARYRPSIGDTSGDVYRLSLNGEDTDVLIQRAQMSGLGLGKNMVDRSLGHYLGDHTVGRGHDKKGEYISYYDKYDLNPFTGGTPVKTGIKGIDKWLQTTTILSNIDLSMGIGKPFELYDRIYLDDYYGVPKEARGGNFLPEVTVTGKKKK
jgi:hypothetical protein